MDDNNPSSVRQSYAEKASRNEAINLSLIEKTTVAVETFFVLCCLTEIIK